MQNVERNASAREGGLEEFSMTAKGIERAAYVAAHRILESNSTAADLARSGAPRADAVDMIAGIIREAFEFCNLAADELGSSRERRVETRLLVVNHRRAGVVLEFPVRALPVEIA
jgi:hypothetical protein